MKENTNVLVNDLHFRFVKNKMTCILVMNKNWSQKYPYAYAIS